MRQAAAICSSCNASFSCTHQSSSNAAQDSPESGQPLKVPKTPVPDKSLEAALHFSSRQDGPVHSKAVNTAGRATAHHRQAMAPAADLSSEASEHASVCQDGLAGVKHLLLEGVI